MNISPVSYNYGYSNQKAQRNNQQAFGMAVGNSLRAELARQGTAIRGLGADAIGELQQDLTVLRDLPASAEFLSGIGYFIRDGQYAHVFDGKMPKGINEAKAEICEVKLKALHHADLKEVADKLPEAEARLAEAEKALAEHDKEFVDDLVENNLGATGIETEIETFGADLDIAVANARADVIRAKNAKNMLEDGGFFNRKLSDDEVAYLNKLDNGFRDENNPALIL